MDIYDTIIVGGGISGLYAGLLILRKNPKHRLLILEKERYLGGRILTYTDKYMNVEKGGARFNEYHTRMLDLVANYKLESRLVEISGDAAFYPGKHNDLKPEPMTFIESLINPVGVLVNVLSEAFSPMPIVPLIARVIIYSKLVSRAHLISHTFVQLAEEVLTKDEIATILGGFGYYTELVEMNARDAIALMEGGLNPSNQFYVLRGGLSQLIAKMVAELNHGGRIILTDVDVASIEYLDNHFLIKSKSGKKFYGLGCICALPREAAQRLTIFRPISSMLDKILCFPLCRIYSKFDMTNRDNAWIRDLPKLTTDNDLRIVIPIDAEAGVIMSSYTDHHFADAWLSLYEKEGIKGVNKELQRLFQMMLGHPVCAPISTKVFHWKCGVGYWGVGADSDLIAEAVAQPIVGVPLYLCGEHYSAKNQQWIEGALETAENVVEKYVGLL
jgi:monoamine oxidase